MEMTGYVIIVGSGHSWVLPLLCDCPWCPSVQATLPQLKLLRNQFDKVILHDERSSGVAGGVAFIYHHIPMKLKSL